MIDLLRSVWEALLAVILANPVAQAVGGGALLIAVAAYQGRTPKQILLLQGLACVFWVAHYALLGALTGAILNALSVARNLIYMQRGKRPMAEMLLWPILFSVIFVISALWDGFTGTGWICVFSTLGSVIANFVLRMKSPQPMRMLLVLTSGLWLIYNILSGSIAATLCESFNICSLIVALIRYRKQAA